MNNEIGKSLIEDFLAQKQLHEQRAELIRQQEALAEERRRYAQRDPLVAKAITHVGITLACLLPLALCWYFLSQPADPHLEPAVNDLLLEDLTAKQPKLIAPAPFGGTIQRLSLDPDAPETGN